ncbi:MAG: hypothetical protein ACYCTI_05945 [Acidimicrobiales bacterium]
MVDRPARSVALILTGAAPVSEQQLADYQQLFDNARHLRELVDQLEALTLQVIQSDGHSKR